jgi:hypothetical protein
VAAVLVIAAVLGLAGCTSDADVASENVSKEAEKFHVLRHIVGVDLYTGEYLLEILGYCNIHVDREDKQLEVTCKVDGGFQKHFLGFSDNSTYTVQQVNKSDVSTDRYQFIIKPSALIPDFRVR